METLASILPYLDPGDSTVSIDLLDTYLHVPSRSVKRLARFYIQRKRLSLQSTALRAQARTSPIHEASRMRGRFPPSAGVAEIFCYLDDWLMVANSPPPLCYGSTCPPVTDSAGPRFHYQLGQVGAHPDSVPESGDYRYPPAAGAAQPEEDRHFVAVGPATPWPTASPGQDMASVPGFSIETSRRPSGLPTAHGARSSCFSQELPTGAGTPLLQTGPPCPDDPPPLPEVEPVRNSRARATHWGSPAHP